MKNSATDIMQEILFSTVMDAVAALKAASKGMPNSLLRDINAMGPNTAFGDLPKDVQDGITGAVRAAFNRLLKEGYSITPTGSAPPPPRPASPRPDRPRGPRPPSSPPRSPSTAGRGPRGPKR